MPASYQCPLCGSRGPVWKRQAGGGAIMGCAHCDHGYTNANLWPFADVRAKLDKDIEATSPAALALGKVTA